MQGFFRSICSLAGLILGIELACWNYAHVAAIFRPIVRIEAVADAIAFLLIALLVMALANLVGIMLKRVFDWMGLGCLDAFGGAIVGLGQGILMVTICILVTVAFFPETQWLTEARFPSMFFGALHVSTHVTPGELSQRIVDGLKTLEKESPKWMREKTGGSL